MKKKTLLSMAAVMSGLLFSGCTTFDMPKSVYRTHEYPNPSVVRHIPAPDYNAPDLTSPVGSVFGMKPTFEQGEAVNITINGQDNKGLSLLSLTIDSVDEGETILSKSWTSSGKRFEAKQVEFTTEGLQGSYAYTLNINDMDGNQYKIGDTFFVDGEIDPTDLMPPVGSVLGVKPKFQQGETVNITLKAQDNEELKTLSFTVSPVDGGAPVFSESWTSEGEQSETKKVSFTTEGMPEGQYQYTLNIDDIEGNQNQVEETFFVEAEMDPQEVYLDLVERIDEAAHGCETRKLAKIFRDKPRNLSPEDNATLGKMVMTDTLKCDGKFSIVAQDVARAISKDDRSKSVSMLLALNACASGGQTQSISNYDREIVYNITGLCAPRLK
jgi:hypothetical protein